MIKLLPFCVFLVFMFGCNNNQKPKATPEQPVSSDTIISDTLVRVNQLPIEFYDLKSSNKDTFVILDDVKYTLKLTAVLDTSNKRSVTEIYTHEGKIYKDLYFGYDAKYSITLLDPSYNTIFSRSFTKDTFIFNDGTLIQSNAYLPDFMGFQKSFDAFLFTIDFWVPSSDVGERCFFMLNRKGNIIEKSASDYFGVGSCNGDVLVSPDSTYVLTCYKIIRPDGQHINIDSKEFNQIGVKLINDNCILVIQNYDEKTNPDNAVLMDSFGKPFKKFSYNGYYETLSPIVPMYFDSLTHNYFLLDEKSENLRVINKTHPEMTYAINLKEMQKFSYDKKNSEIEFDINSMLAKNTFYLDTLSNKIRHKKY